MPDIFRIKYTGVKPRPTELLNSEIYRAKYPDTSATFTRESPLLTQFKNAEKSVRDKRKT